MHKNIQVLCYFIMIYLLYLQKESRTCKNPGSISSNFVKEWKHMADLQIKYNTMK